MLFLQRPRDFEQRRALLRFSAFCLMPAISNTTIDSRQLWNLTAVEEADGSIGSVALMNDELTP